MRYISSPYDEEAHTIGYKVHLMENGEVHLSLLITHVETTSAPVSGNAMTATIYAERNRKEFLSSEHIVDTGYVDAKLLMENQWDYLVGLASKNYHLGSIGYYRTTHKERAGNVK